MTDSFSRAVQDCGFEASFAEELAVATQQHRYPPAKLLTPVRTAINVGVLDFKQLSARLRAQRRFELLAQMTIRPAEQR